MRLLAFGALAALLGLAGHVMGAEARIGVVFPPIPPIAPGETEQIEGNLTYSYDASSENSTVVSLELDGIPAWLDARLHPTALVLPANGTGTSVSAVTLNLTVGKDTPALTQATLEIRAQAAANPPLNATASAASIPVKAAYLGKVRVEAQRVVAQRPGEPFVVPVALANEANGPTRITFEVTRVPERAHAVAPPAVILEQVGERRTVNVGASASQPGPYSFGLRWAASYAFDPTLPGDSGEEPVRFDVQGGAVPGAGWLGPLALALAFGTALRRRRA